MTPTTHRQRYRFIPEQDPERAPRNPPAWLTPDGVYEGDLGPASQGAPGAAVRLSCPDDPGLCFMVDSAAVREVE